MVKIEIDTNNAAFEGENFSTEIATILRDLTSKVHVGLLDDDSGSISIRDSNGNRVGALIYRKED